jgi:hypothetical protein
MQIRAMKEEEVEEMLEQLADMDAAIRLHILGLHEEPASTAPSEALGLSVVGRAVTSSREAPGGDTAGLTAPALGGDQNSEVFVLSGEEAAERGQLIAAYRPEPVEDGVCLPPAGLEQGGTSRTGPGASPLSPLAWQELMGSLEAGVLSLLVGSGGRVEGAKVLRLLQQLPEAAEGRWEVACVARGLGLHHDASKDALEQLFCSGGQEPAVAAGQTDPTQLENEGTDGGAGSSASGISHVQQAALLVCAEQVQRGLQRLVGMLQNEASGYSMPSVPSGAASPRAPGSAVGPGQHAEAGSSAAYWSRKVEAVLPPEVFQRWALLEPQLARQFKLLKSRSKAADEVRICCSRVVLQRVFFGGACADLPRACLVHAKSNQ